MWMSAIKSKITMLQSVKPQGLGIALGTREKRRDSSLLKGEIIDSYGWMWLQGLTGKDQMERLTEG